MLLRAAVLLLFLAAATWALVRYREGAWQVVTKPGRLQQWVESYQGWGPVVFLGIQVVQVVIFVIPGEVVQVAGGYLFGASLGVVYCVIGALLGAAFAFLAAHVLGRLLVRHLVKPETFDRMEDVLNHHKGIITVFVLFLIPGIPKDSLCYVAGLTPISPRRFLLVSTLARIPGMVLSAWIGLWMAEKGYIQMGLLLGVALLMLVLGLIFQKRSEEWISRRHDRKA